MEVVFQDFMHVRQECLFAGRNWREQANQGADRGGAEGDQDFRCGPAGHSEPDGAKGGDDRKRAKHDQGNRIEQFIANVGSNRIDSLRAQLFEFENQDRQNPRSNYRALLSVLFKEQ